MSSQTHDLHRALLRPFVVHTLRAAGFHSTKPSVLDTLVNISERYIMLLASNAAKHALNSHNDPLPSLSDVRLAMAECGAFAQLDSSAEQEWTEAMRRPVEDMGNIPQGGRQRVVAEKRKREEEDVADVREFLRWFDGTQHTEIKRVAGMAPDATANGVAVHVGVGGGMAHAEDFLERLKKRHHKAGDDTRLQGTVLGKAADESDKGVVVEGGPVQHLRDWKPATVEEHGARKPSITQSEEVMAT